MRSRRATSRRWTSRKAGASYEKGVTLSFTDASIMLDVRDDGVGFEPDARRRIDSYGLTVMRTRVEQIDELDRRTGAAAQA